MSDMERLKEKLQQAQEFNSILGEHLDKNFLIEGKTVLAWKNYFKVEIPSEINFLTLIDMGAQIFQKFQLASYYRDKENIQMVILEQSKVDKFNDAYQEARTESEERFGKPMSAESCKVHAMIATKDIEDAISNQKVVREFWIKTCDTLHELRKLLELIGYALNADSRISREFTLRGNNDH